MNAEQAYYEAMDKWGKAVDQKVVSEIQMRSRAAKKAQMIVDMINAGYQIDEPDGEDYHE